MNIDYKEDGVSTYTVGRTIFGDNRDQMDEQRGFGFIIEGNDNYVPGSHDAEKKKLGEITAFCSNLCRKYGQDSFTFVTPYGVKGRLLVGHATRYGTNFVSCSTDGKDVSAVFNMEESSMVELSAARIMRICEHSIAQQIEVSRLSTGVAEHMDSILKEIDDKKKDYENEQKRMQATRYVKAKFSHALRQNNTRAALYQCVKSLSKDEADLAVKIFRQKNLAGVVNKIMESISNSTPMMDRHNVAVR